MPRQEIPPGGPLFLPAMPLGMQETIDVGDSMFGADCPQDGQFVNPGVELEQIVLGKPTCDDIMPNWSGIGAFPYSEFVDECCTRCWSRNR
jgi:hypothetical protein